MLLCSHPASGQKSSHSPHLLRERPARSSAPGWCDPGFLGSLLGLLAPHMPCPAPGVEVQSLIRAYKTNRLISEALASLSSVISYHPHVLRVIPNSRADPALDQCPEQPAASPCSFAWLAVPLCCCTSRKRDMSAQRPVTCKHHPPVLKQKVQKLHLISFNISLFPGQITRLASLCFLFRYIGLLKNAPIPAFSAPWCNGYERSVSDYAFKRLGGQGVEAGVKLTAPTTYKQGTWLCLVQ